MRGGIWAEDRWRDRPWPKDRPLLRPSSRLARVAADVRMWVFINIAYVAWAVWELTTGHYLTAILPTALGIQAVILIWLRRREIAAIWRCSQ